MTNPVWGSIGALASGTTGAITPVAPAHVAGDWLWIVAEHANASNAITPTLGGGSAFVLRGAQTNSTTTSGLAIWRAKATGPGMTIPAIGGNAGQDHICALVFTVSGLQNDVGDDPAIAMVVANLSAAASTSMTASTLGLVNATNALIVDIVSRSNDSAAANFSAWTNSGLANLTERFDAGTIDGNGGGFGINTGDLAAPATLAATTVTSVANVRWASISIALRSTIKASATFTGVSKTGSAGTITAKGAANATLTGVSKTGSAGTIAAKGAASTSLSGVSGTGHAGTISAGGQASATVSGVSATGSAGSVSPTGAARATITGAEAAGNAGTILATSGSIAIFPGVEAVGSAGTITANGGVQPQPAPMPRGAIGSAGPVRISRPGVAKLPGVRSRATAGRLTAEGAARVLLASVVADTMLGMIGFSLTFNIPGTRSKARAGYMEGVGIHEISDDEIFALLSAIED